jgi:hypothetical protein
MAKTLRQVADALQLNGEQFEIFMKYKLREMLDAEQAESKLDYPGLSGKVTKQEGDNYTLKVVTLNTGEISSHEFAAPERDLPESSSPEN